MCVCVCVCKSGEGRRDTKHNFIIAEIERKGFLAIIDDYLNDENIHRIYNHPKNVDETFKFKLLRKIRNNYKKLRQNDNFLIEEYCPSEELMDSINNAFEKFDSLPNIWKFYSSKSTDCLNPSKEDKMLILFSKEKECPVISDDFDITFFHKELFNLGLVNEIIEFRSISLLTNDG